MRPPVIRKRAGQELTLPEPFIIEEELTRQKNRPLPVAEPEALSNYQMPYWRPPHKEAPLDVIIIEL